MVTGISGNSGLYRMIASAGITGAGQNGQDPLGVFDTVDQDGSDAISESEFTILAEAVQEVTGTEMNSSFSDFDQNGDGELSAAELKLALDEAGFKGPPPPPPEQVAAAYHAQSGATAQGTTESAAQVTSADRTATDLVSADQAGSGLGPDVKTRILEYIQEQSGSIDFLA